MKITWYGHSCFAVEHAGYTVVFDPYYTGSVPGLVMPSLQANEVLCSHGHKDHGAADQVTLSPAGSPFTLTKVDVFHDHHNGEKRGVNTIHVLEAEGLRVAHLGDLGHPLSARQIEAVGAVDVVLCPVGGFYTVGPQEAKQVVEALGASVVVPMHYRGEGFGYPVIGPVEEFTALCGNVKQYDTNSLTVTAHMEPQTAVLCLPAEVLG